MSLSDVSNSQTSGKEPELGPRFDQGFGPRLDPGSNSNNRRLRLLAAAVAAFSVYFCMYGFRKPFTAGTFEGQELYGVGLKSVLVVSQLAGYMLSKFIGIKVLSEMRTEYRVAAIIGLIAIAEVALVGFAYGSLPVKAAMMFLNGLPLGMIFGLVLSFLEGRRQTEALSAALCASFIISSGVVKSVGRWLIEVHGISEFQMPMLVGLMFFPPLLLAVWVLQTTPPPDASDRSLRNERNVMSRLQRRQFVAAYRPGLMLLVFVYVAITMIRTIRDDFAVEIWQDMGVSKTPSIYAATETIVAVFVTALNALAIWVTGNLAAIRLTIGLMCSALALVIGSAVGQFSGDLSPFLFMIACGVGLYIPYVAFHTTVFERLVAASPLPGNLAFLMYLADALGYLGYAIVMIVRSSIQPSEQILPFFLGMLVLVASVSILALLAAVIYFQRKLHAI